MSLGAPSDEVAEDYKNSLEDLQLNSRYEISNLTVIAKENTEHAMAISRVLENHISKAPPTKKLPALYVLDSVVKNVGTPYTLFFGRNLYSTFMNAYTKVDGPIRKKLDEMLKTWKEPVPGSVDTRPVFPVEVTRPIENALIKARTAFVQQHHAKLQQERLNLSRHVATPPVGWRNTPTPPQAVTTYRPPPTTNSYGPQHGNNGVPNNHSNHQAPPQQYPPVDLLAPSTPAQPVQQASSYAGYPQPSVSVDTLSEDLTKVIADARVEFAANPYHSPIQIKLKALLDLQSIIQKQQLAPDQMLQIKEQITQMAANPTQPVQTLRGTAIADFQPQTQPHLPPQLSQGYQPPPLQTPEPYQPPIQPIFSQNALAQLLAATAKAQPLTPPPPRPALPAPLPVEPTFSTSAAQATTVPLNENSLVASLRAAGMLPPLPMTSTPVSNPKTSTGTPTLPFNLPLLPPKQQASTNTPSMATAYPERPPPTQVEDDVKMTSASLKVSRPHLIATLYEAQPSQCGSCGRRFFATEEGKRQKARHLDWHFKVNQRLGDAVKRGQNRSWYVGEMEWIQSRDNDEKAIANTNGSDAAKSQALAAIAKKDPKNQYIPVPNDQKLASAPCPICQEPFDRKWHDETQDFIWIDAMMVGGRAYHASCHAEMNASRPASRTGKDSVLGKRKAELGDLNSLRARLKREVAV
ncbi:MAG: hypothetical protein M1836_002895 [Candelina mexicana]|nr:MAG: hypothetical protein M1836_002895 [Candelina mexicana]